MIITKELIQEEIARQERRDSEQDSQTALQQALDDFAQEDDLKVVDIISFVEASWGLNSKPYPIQRFILKVIYGLPLDSLPRDIEIWDKFRENLLAKLSEREMLHFLHEEKRINVSLEDYEKEIGKSRTTIILRLGRRGTKTTLSQWIAAYEIYKLLRKRNPQSYYRLRQEQPIRITLVATGKDQSQDLLAPARAAIKRAPFLNRFVRGDSRQKLELTTQFNIEAGLGSDSGILVTAAPCSAKGLRGPANILALLEEYGFFFWELQGSNKSDLSIWRAVAPSTADFRNPETGDPEGRVMVISTPLSRESHMHTVEERIKSGEIKSGLFLHIPSWWVNPLLAPEVLENEWNLDRLGFRQEFGAEYLDQIESAVVRADLERCRNDPGPDSYSVHSGEITWMGLDLGLRNDGTSISVVACDREGNLRLVHNEVHRTRLGRVMNGILEPGYEQEELDIEEMAKRVDEVWRYWGCKGGMGDQWNSYGLKSYLKSGARQKLEFVEVNRRVNDKIARVFIAVIQQGKVKIYEKEDAWEDPDSILKEFTRLQRNQTGGHPPSIRIEAPNVRGYHDDQYSSISRGIWMARMNVENMAVPAGKTSKNPAFEKRMKIQRERAEILRAQAVRAGRARPQRKLRR